MRWAGLLALVFSIPATTHAQIFIQEIMYAPEGADADREWVEVCNTGTTAIDIEGWKLYENETNHSISLVEGATLLDENVCAVFADDAVTFKIDYPTFSGNLFDSAFSLKNTGEDLVLKDDSGVEIDSVTYDDSLGAKDSGESLHRDGSTFYAAAPSPGEFESVNSDTQDSNDYESVAPTTDVITTLYSYDSVTIQPPEDVYIRAADIMNAVVGSYIQFSAETHDATGAAFTDGVVVWSFGDGGTATGRTVRHKYRYEGEYVATANVQRGSLFDEKRIKISVVPALVFVTVKEQGDVIAITNTSEFEIDVSDWRLHASGQHFTIPRGTYIAANQTAHFPREVTNLAFVTRDSEVWLVFPDGEFVTTSKEQAPESADHATPEEDEHEDTEEHGKTESVVQSISHENSVIGRVVSQPREAHSTIDTAEENEPQEEKYNNQEAAAAVVLSQTSDSGKGDVYWYLILVVLIGFSIIGVLLAKQRTLRVHGFEIIEKKDG